MSAESPSLNARVLEAGRHVVEAMRPVVGAMQRLTRAIAPVLDRIDQLYLNMEVRRDYRGLCPHCGAKVYRVCLSGKGRRFYAGCMCSGCGRRLLSSEVLRGQTKAGEQS